MLLNDVRDGEFLYPGWQLLFNLCLSLSTT